MNKNVAFAVFGLLALVGLGGSIYLLIERPDANATFTSLLVQVLGLVVVAGGLGAGLNQLDKKVESVSRQTNGTLSALREENDRLTQQNIELAKQIPTAAVDEHDGRTGV